MEIYKYIYGFIYIHTYIYNVYFHFYFSFGKSHHDELTILAPVYQCCLIRYSTLLKLFHFYQGPVPLSQLMQQSMAADALFPILTDSHLQALDRRVGIVLRTVYECIMRGNAVADVIVDDGF